MAGYEDDGSNEDMAGKGFDYYHQYVIERAYKVEPKSSSVRNDYEAAGQFVDHACERFYVIHNVDSLPPFFINLVSNSDHWLFISSNGSLTAGRVSPETALFPYVTVDKIHDSDAHTGSKTLIRVKKQNFEFEWEPFNREHDGHYLINRHLYKNLLGNKLCFEEVNHDLQLVYRYTWASSDSHGFVRQCELQNIGDENLSVDIVDGLQNILPASTPRAIQASASNLVDAYKWTELDEQTNLAMFTLYSGITDRSDPCESLNANTVFCLGLVDYKVLISSQQIDSFRNGKTLQQEVHKRGIRGAYLINATMELAPQASRHWQFVANIEQSQSQVVALRQQLSNNPAELAETIALSINNGSDELARIMASSDGFQATAEENVTAHHYANVLFSVLRGGIFDDQYNVSSKDFKTTVKHFNRLVYKRHKKFLNSLPEKVDFNHLQSMVRHQGSIQLERLCYEYLPITFGRRHGDPSRPWNEFAIKLKDENGERLLSYQGNWRDIFQNWEALAYSYPEYIENIIAKFVNASTVDGYNPYRITKQGIDWEEEEQDDPWSNIGYWGDHQIIYLLKFLELSNNFHPEKLGALLHQPIFSYANVPYRIKPIADLLLDAKDTVEYDEVLAEKIEDRVESIGADGKLVLDTNGNVYHVNLLEKLLVPLLSKLGNLVVDGGIWLNTQRPEWNDANNALVGQGLSMVTLYYLRRYVNFLQNTLATETVLITLSTEVATWLSDTAAALSNICQLMNDAPLNSEQRMNALLEISSASSRYREILYKQEGFSDKTELLPEQVRALLDDALDVIDRSIESNLRKDGLYESYNILNIKKLKAIDVVNTPYPMLEGQVAALSAGALSPRQVISVLSALFDSKVYRADQRSFMLYPDRHLPKFLDKNKVREDLVQAVPVLVQMLEAGDETLILRDVEGDYRFSEKITNSNDLNSTISALLEEYGEFLEDAREPIKALYEQVFNHQAFTGRSGGMFGFEGLGCIYWHMVSKLLLAVEENFFSAIDSGADAESCKQLGKYYYQIRNGIGFNKTPEEYGAFPTDPYSHTPKHAGAQQPGMTGQVKEEVLSRFGELGVRVSDGKASFQPALLRAREFVAKPRHFRYLDVANRWKDLTVPVNGLAFTWCQVPVVYQINDKAETSLTITWANGGQQVLPALALSSDDSASLFQRDGRIRQLTLVFGSQQIFSE